VIRRVSRIAGLVKHPFLLLGGDGSRHIWMIQHLSKNGVFWSGFIVTKVQRSTGFKWRPRCCLRNGTLPGTLLIRWGRQSD
jgi:hypothetical protein